MYNWVGYNKNVSNGSGCREGHGGINGKVLPGVFNMWEGRKYIPLYSVAMVSRVELGPASQLEGIQKGTVYWSRVVRIVVFLCQVL